ncbi:MAG: DUF2911 domain-containing protein [Terriglobia bacterium]
MISNKRLITLLTMCALAGLSIAVYGHGNEEGSAKATIGSAKVSIEFHKPTLKGRDLMKMIHPGDLWRLGADASTTIESDSDLDFGGTRVPKGKYVLLARYLEPGKWTLVVSSKDRMHYEPSAKLAEIPMDVQQAPDSVEAMNIEVVNKGATGEIEIAWGTYRLKASFAPAK